MIQVLQVAVVADVHRGSGVDEVRNKKIRIQVLGRRQAGEGRVRQYGGVLHDDARREFGGELVIPLRANDVVVEGSATVVGVTQPEPKVSIVDAKVVSGNDAEIGGHTVAARQVRFESGRWCVVDAAAPPPVDIKNNLLVGRSTEEEELGIAVKIFVLREDGEIPRAEKFSLVGISESHASLSRHLEK